MAGSLAAAGSGWTECKQPESGPGSARTPGLLILSNRFAGVQSAWRVFRTLSACSAVSAPRCTSTVRLAALAH